MRAVAGRKCELDVVNVTTRNLSHLGCCCFACGHELPDMDCACDTVSVTILTASFPRFGQDALIWPPTEPDRRVLWRSWPVNAGGKSYDLVENIATSLRVGLSVRPRPVVGLFHLRNRQHVGCVSTSRDPLVQ